jgi:hypothetical protein
MVPKLRKFDGFLVSGKLAVQAEFDGKRRIDFVLEDGSHGFIYDPDATPEDLATTLAELELVIPLVRKK